MSGFRSCMYGLVANANVAMAERGGRGVGLGREVESDRYVNGEHGKLALHLTITTQLCKWRYHFARKLTGRVKRREVAIKLS